MKTNLRFAALRRVSTEKQEKIGESLRTQTTNLERFVSALDGSIVEWYGGQEHATPGHEKKEVERLIGDAQKKRFDAVIVNDADRWSRDNTHSTAGLEVFKQHGILFYTGGTEWNLFNPSHVLFLSMNAVIGQFFALNQKRKSLENRIERAKRGIPTGGKLPFGRKWIWDDPEVKKSGRWERDLEKAAMVQDCAKRYLAGEAIEDLANEYQVNASNLHKVLTKVSGTEWQVEFKAVDLNIHEIVPIKIPELLEDNTIAAIRKKAKLNRTYQHGKIVHEYLFSRMISCAQCGYAMLGQTNHSNRRYYRHLCLERHQTCPGAKWKTWIPAGQIEDAVMRHLFETFGNPSAVRRAIKEATPNDEGIREAAKRLERVTGELEKLKSSRKRILDWSVKGTISDDDATTKLEEMKQREQKLNAERTRLDDELAHVPSQEKIRSISKLVAGQFRRYTNARVQAKARQANEAFEEMTGKERRELCEMVFSGEMMDGRRMGVWITWSADGKKWQYRIEGHLIDETGPVNPKWFTFGDAPQQKALVAESALH